jgi:hypothetical protein
MGIRQKQAASRSSRRLADPRRIEQQVKVVACPRNHNSTEDIKRLHKKPVSPEAGFLLPGTTWVPPEIKLGPALRRCKTTLLVRKGFGRFRGALVRSDADRFHAPAQESRSTRPMPLRQRRGRAWYLMSAFAIEARTAVPAAWTRNTVSRCHPASSALAYP